MSDLIVLVITAASFGLTWLLVQIFAAFIARKKD